MFNIDKFLEKISKSLNSSELNKKQILEIINKEVELSLDRGAIEIKNNIIYLKTFPAARNKIFIEKNKIIDQISKLSIKILDIK